MVDADGVESINDMFHENTMLQTENNNLRVRVKALQQTVDGVTAKNIALLAEHSTALMASGEGMQHNSFLLFSEYHLHDVAAQMSMRN